MQSTLYTAVQQPPLASRQLIYGEPILSLGSCFSEHIGQYLADQGHYALVNPFGALYNPLSIAQALERLVEGKAFSAGELLEYDGLYHSSMHHGSYSSASVETTLERINRDYQEASSLLPGVRYLLLTWGSAFVYTDRASGAVVANCHKRPERCFERRLVEVEELVSRVLPVLSSLLEQHPKLMIITTISPIRHLRDTAHGNALSKATLLLMDEALRRRLGERYLYYPAYEILLDELRDYRFYADDLCHPSPLAIKLIRERFAEWISSPEGLSLGREVLRLRAQWTHRPLHPDHPEAELRREQLALLIASLLSRHPELRLDWFSAGSTQLFAL